MKKDKYQKIEEEIKLLNLLYEEFIKAEIECKKRLHKLIMAKIYQKSSKYLQTREKTREPRHLTNEI